MAWVDILSTATDADSPVNETLTDQLRLNQEFLFDSAERRGTFIAPVRRAIARSIEAFSWVSITSGQFEQDIAINFATDADDGDPNFASNDFNVKLSMEQDDSGSNVTWAVAALASVFAFVKDPSTTTLTDITITVRIYKLIGTNQNVAGKLHWWVDGPVTAGE